MRHKKHENRNELVSILDELLLQEAISYEVYTQVNNFLESQMTIVVTVDAAVYIVK